MNTPMKKVSVFLPVDVHRRLKIKAARKGTSVQRLSAEAILRSLSPNTAKETPASPPALTTAERSHLKSLFAKARRADSPTVRALITLLEKL